MECVGTDADHCCWLGSAGRCSYLVEHHAGRRWSCSLRAELGTWGAVHVDRRYLADVRPVLDAIGVGVDCGDWPPPGVGCATCGGVNGG